MTAATLQQYLMEAASTPWTWGLNDCCTLVADWSVWQGNDDPMARWRGEYDCEAGARAFMAYGGGIIDLMTLGMIEAGIPECDEPRLGDVGIVTVLGEHGPEEVGAIYGGKRWHMRSPNGLFCASIAKQFVHMTWRP